MATDTLADKVVFYAPFTSDFYDQTGNIADADIVQGNADALCTIENEEGPAGTGYLLAPSTGYLKLPLDLNIGSSPFCVDGWFRMNDASIVGIYSVDGILTEDYSNLLLCGNQEFVSTSGNRWEIYGYSISTSADAWFHHAVTWDGSVIRGFTNGVMKWSYNFVGEFTQRGTMTTIGKKMPYMWEGPNVNVQHFRVTKGDARYTASFTPPTDYPNYDSAATISGSGPLLDMAFQQVSSKDSGSGSILNLAFRQGRGGVGSLLDLAFEQTVKIAAGGPLLAFDFAFRRAGSGNLLNLGFKQTRAKKQRRFKGKRGDGQPLTIGLNGESYDLSVRIGGQPVDMCSFCESFTVSHGENQSYTCTFTLLDKKDRKIKREIDIWEWHNKEITVDVVSDSKTVRIFTGRVDGPEIHLLTGKRQISCSDRREQQNNALPRSVIDGIGYYSKAALGDDFDSQNDELEARLQTVPASFEYDAYGTYYLTSWLPKAVPDHVMGPCQIYERDPTVSAALAGRVTNKVEFTLTRQYTREIQRNARYYFDSGLNVCSYGQYLLPPFKADLKTTVNDAGWAFKLLSYEPLEPSGWINCGNSQIPTYWNSQQSASETTTEYKTDENGNYVLDENGDKIVVSTSKTKTQNRFLYARNAWFEVSKRFTQNVKETQNIVVSSAVSVAEYGEVKSSVSYSVDNAYDEDDASTWGDNYHQVASPGSAYTRQSNGDWYRNYDNVEAGEYDRTLLCGLQTAYTKILASHRENSINLQVKFMPALDLRHTHRIEHSNVTGNAKVCNFTHTFDIKSGMGTTDIEYKFFHCKNGGTAFDSLTNATVARPTDTLPTPSTGVFVDNSAISKANVRIGTIYLTVDQDTNAADSQCGYIVKYVAGSLHKYPVAVKFNFVSPEIEEESTETRELENNTDFNVGIPNGNVRVFI